MTESVLHDGRLLQFGQVVELEAKLAKGFVAAGLAAVWANKQPRDDASAARDQVDGDQTAQGKPDSDPQAGGDRG